MTEIYQLANSATQRPKKPDQPNIILESVHDGGKCHDLLNQINTLANGGGQVLAKDMVRYCPIGMLTILNI